MTIIATSFIMIISFIVITYNLYLNNSKKLLEEENILQVKQTSKYITLVMDNIQHSLDIFVDDPSNQKYFHTINNHVGHGNYEFYSTISDIKSTISNIQSIIDGVTDIRVYLDANKVLISNSHGLLHNQEEQTYSLYEELYSHLQESNWFNGDDLQKLTHEDLSQSLVYSKPLYSLYTGELEGMIVVLYSKSTLFDMFESTSESNKVMVNKDNNMILNLKEHTATNQLLYIENWELHKDNEPYEVTHWVNHIGVKAPLPYTDWSIVSVNTIGLSHQEKKQLLQFVIVMIGAIALLAGVVIKKLHHSLFKRLDKLTTAMNTVSKGDLKVEIQDDTNDDLNYIIVNFNTMVSSLEESLQEIYHQKILQQEAELKALHNQINPHFIYNIFDNMNWMLQLNKLDELECLMDAVSQYYKSMLAYSKQVITIEGVKLQIENYLQIQSIRFTNKLTYSIEFNINSDYEILNYLLLPIVENAVNHGVEPSIHPCHISIKAWEDSHYIYFHIVDSGVGIHPEKLNQIYKLMESEKVVTGNRYYGLVNIYTRLKGLYKDEATLDIESLQRGIGVTIKIPIRECDHNV